MNYDLKNRRLRELLGIGEKALQCSGLLEDWIEALKIVEYRREELGRAADNGEAK